MWIWPPCGPRNASHGGEWSARSLYQLEIYNWKQNAVPAQQSRLKPQTFLIGFAPHSGVNLAFFIQKHYDMTFLVTRDLKCPKKYGT